MFSVPHLAYHLAHFDGLSALDITARIISVSSTAVLGGLLLLGPLRISPAAASVGQSGQPR